MKRITVLLLSLFAIAGIISLAIAQNNPDTKDPVGQDKAMQEFIAMMQPGDAHAKLEKFVGKWTTHTRVFMDGGDKPMMEYDGSAESKWILGKRFVQWKGSGNMGGMQNEEFVILGYDNFRHLYTGAFASSMGTSINTMSGSMHPESGTLMMYGEMDEPSIGVIARNVKYRYSFPDNNTIRLDVIDLHADEDYRVVEVTFTRQP